MEIFVMVKFGQVINVSEIVKLSTMAYTKLQKGLKRTVAAVVYRRATTLGFGATGIVVMVL